MKNLQKTAYYFIKFAFEFGWPGVKLFLGNYFSRKKLLRFESRKVSNPIYIRSKTSDFELFFDIFIKKAYRTKVERTPKIIIDLGSNIGLASAYFKQQYPNSEVIAIEPEKSNFDILLANTKNIDGITCINKAIWSSITNIEIIDNGYGEWGFMVKETKEKTQSSFESISIDKIVEDYSITNIDILKIDIEGSEKELFEQNFEKWLPITDMIIIELHDNMRAGASKSFFNAISPYNYRIEIKGENIFCWLNHSSK